MPKPQYAGPWQRLRRIVLERDGGLCQIRAHRCTTKATEVDHINPVDLGGSWWDLDNLRASCKPCNVGRVAAQQLESWRQGPPITLVYGPPGAGKTTYVAQHAKPGELVVDYDAIASALGADRAQSEQIHEAVMAARNAVLTKIRQNRTGAPAVWIISANPRAAEMFPHHEAVYLNPGCDISKSQAVGRTAGALAAVDGWPTRGWPWD
jgi:hypothetical protein